MEGGDHKYICIYIYICAAFAQNFELWPWWRAVESCQGLSQPQRGEATAAHRPRGRQTKGPEAKESAQRLECSSFWGSRL